jgi:zinc transport system substrate-binding protein
MRRLTIGIVIAALALAGCGADDSSVRAEQRDKPVVVVGLWPIAELARTVGGNDVVVVDLTPLGESPHGLTLTPRQRREIVDADLAIVVGKGFQPEVERAAAGRDGPTLDLLARLALSDRPDGSPGPADPHVWMDPTLMGTMATMVGEALAGIVPHAAGAIHARAQHAVEDDVRLDAQIGRVLQSCRQRVIASQHESFGWFAARYGLTNVAFDGPEPDDDPAPDPAYLDRITPALGDGSITTLFIELLEPTSWVEVIADEHGLDTAELDPYEGRSTDEDTKSETTYRSVLLDDVATLQDELECRS